MLAKTENYSPRIQPTSTEQAKGRSDIFEFLSRLTRESIEQEFFDPVFFDIHRFPTKQSQHNTVNIHITGPETSVLGEEFDRLFFKWLVCLIDQDQIDICLKGFESFQSVIKATEYQGLFNLYSFLDSTSVKEFLNKNPQIVPFLIDAYPFLVKYFSSSSYFELQVFTDMEVDNYEKLFCHIVTSLSVDEAFANLNDFDNEFFLDQLDRVGDLLNFNLDFI